MGQSIEFSFKHPLINRIVKAGFPGAKTRRPVKVSCYNTYHVMDFWDGGSRNYCAFVRLPDMSSLSSESIPREERQVQSNPFNLPVADVLIQPGFCVVESVVFCGKPLGYRIYISSDDISSYLPEASTLIPMPPKPEMPELTP